MNGYCHKRSFDVRYSDVDFQDVLKPSSFLAFAQDAASTSADELGFGYGDLKPLGYGFLVVATCCEFLRPVRVGEKVEVGTWPLPPRHVIFERDYRLTDEKGEVCAAAASRWCLVDLKNMALLTPDKLNAHASCPYNPEKALSGTFKVEKPDGSEREVRRLQATPSLCDHFLHVNNARYLDLFLDCFSMEELSARPLKGFRISYAKQIRAGSEIVLLRRDAGAESFVYAVSGGELCTLCALVFSDGGNA